MKIVKYGYENSQNPTGSFEGIGFNMRENGKCVGPVTGEYLGVVRISSDDYLIARTKEAFANDENYVGNTCVRRALADLYPDGSGILFIDQETDHMCRQLERLFDHEKTRELMDSGIDAKRICGGDIPPFAFECVTRGDKVFATAIEHDAFEEKRALISRCHNSFSNLEKELEQNYVDIADMNKSM